MRSTFPAGHIAAARELAAAGAAREPESRRVSFAVSPGLNRAAAALTSHPARRVFTGFFSGATASISWIAAPLPEAGRHRPGESRRAAGLGCIAPCKAARARPCRRAWRHAHARSTACAPLIERLAGRLAAATSRTTRARFSRTACTMEEQRAGRHGATQYLNRHWLRCKKIKNPRAWRAPSRRPARLRGFDFLGIVHRFAYLKAGRASFSPALPTQRGAIR